uniref:N-acetyltransferase ESCO1 n=1 Tax=Aceria tosichella TaxID=561515 RepID=A0A6G1SK48_9ACAR
METRKRKPLLVKANEQYVLDFGQKNIDPIRCPTCGMLYVVGEESDEKQHAKYHSEFDEGVKWSVRLERAKKYFDDGSRIVAILPNDPKPVIDAVNKLLKMSDGDMITGCDVQKILNRPNTLFLIYVTPTNHVVGYICVEPIKEAHNLIDFDSSRMEEEPVRADCGILYLWVHPAYRRRKIATQLTDIARGNVRRDIVFRSRVAVCDPTELAIPFLSAYLLHKRPVKVYQNN